MTGKNAIHTVIRNELVAAEPADPEAARLEAVAQAEEADRQHHEQQRQGRTHEPDEQSEEHSKADGLPNRKHRTGNGCQREDSRRAKP